MRGSNAFQDIELTRIRPNPWNPRTRFEGPKFDELVASIRAKEVLEPITVRPIFEQYPSTKSDHQKYEIVFGERRHRASAIAGKETIPCLVRELSDEEAFEFMTIENLQREDLTAFEEVQSFKAFVDRKGPDAVFDLADRIGIEPRYIKRRLRVLSLPAEILKAWEEDKILFGHLEQLRRLADEKEIAELFKRMMRPDAWGDKEDGLNVRSVAFVKMLIDERSIDLKAALFDRAGCKNCEKNSLVQKNMFAVDGPGKAYCLDVACFKKNQYSWLLVPENWKKTRWAKKEKTNGFRFDDGIKYTEYQTMWNPQRKECQKCENFVSIISLMPDRNDYSRPACVDLACYKKTFRSREAADSRRTKEQNRSHNHGLLFREEFFKARIPEVVKEIPPTDEKISRLTLASILHSNLFLRDWFFKPPRIKKAKYATEGLFQDMASAWKCLEEMDPEEVTRAIKEASLKIALEQPLFGAKARAMVGKYFGLELARDWRIDEAYLKAKTKAEILRLGKDLKILIDKKAQAYLYETLGKKRGKFDGLKKTELIGVFLKSGVDLAGKVPKEILQEQK